MFSSVVVRLDPPEVLKYSPPPAPMPRSDERAMTPVFGIDGEYEFPTVRADMQNKVASRTSNPTMLLNGVQSPPDVFEQELKEDAELILRIRPKLGNMDEVPALASKFAMDYRTWREGYLSYQWELFHKGHIASLPPGCPPPPKGYNPFA